MEYYDFNEEISFISNCFKELKIDGFDKGEIIKNYKTIPVESYVNILKEKCYQTGNLEILERLSFYGFCY